MTHHAAVVAAPSTTPTIRLGDTGLPFVGGLGKRCVASIHEPLEIPRWMPNVWAMSGRVLGGPHGTGLDGRPCRSFDARTGARRRQRGFRGDTFLQVVATAPLPLVTHRERGGAR